MEFEKQAKHKTRVSLRTTHVATSEQYRSRWRTLMEVRRARAFGRHRVIMLPVNSGDHPRRLQSTSTKEDVWMLSMSCCWRSTPDIRRAYSCSWVVLIHSSRVVLFKGGLSAAKHVIQVARGHWLANHALYDLCDPTPAERDLFCSFQSNWCHELG